MTAEVYVGVDLATTAKRTGVCELTWPRRGKPRVRFLSPGQWGTDDDLVNEFIGATSVAIDVPFGWPTAFVKVVAQWNSKQRWLGPSYMDVDASKHLRYRATDLEVARRVKLAITSRNSQLPAGGKKLRFPQPGISISTNLLGATALRGAGLLELAHDRGVPFDRGSDDPGKTRIVEAYPASALAAWDLTWGGLDCTWPDVPIERLTSRLEFEDKSQITRRDNFDALVCAVVARAWHQRQVVSAADIAPHHLAEEGWIAYPKARLEELFA